MQAQCDWLASHKALLRMWLCFLNEPLSLMNEAYVYVFVRVLSRLPAECRVLLCLQPRQCYIPVCRCNNMWCTQGLLVSHSNLLSGYT